MMMHTAHPLFLLQCYHLFAVTMLSNISSYSIITSFLLHCYHLFPVTMLSLVYRRNGRYDDDAHGSNASDDDVEDDDEPNECLRS